MASAEPVDELLGAATAERSFDERQARRWQQQRDGESATWEGTLVDLAEAGTQVTLDTVRGVRIVGQLRGVGRDVLAVGRPDGPDVWLRRDRVTMVGLPGSGRCPGGTRPAHAVTLQQLVFSAAAFRPEVRMVLNGRPAAVTGILMSCGADFCALGAEDHVRRTVLVPLSAVDEVTVHG